MSDEITDAYLSALLSGIAEMVDNRPDFKRRWARLRGVAPRTAEAIAELVRIEVDVAMRARR